MQKILYYAYYTQIMHKNIDFMNNLFANANDLSFFFLILLDIYRLSIYNTDKRYIDNLYIIEKEEKKYGS